MKNDLRLIPRASNSFDIEICNRFGKISYILQVNTDGQRCSISVLNENKDYFVDVIGYTGILDSDKKKIKFNYLHIEGVSQ